MVVHRYQGLEVSPDDVIAIRDLIAKSPDASRRAISLKVCEAWNWVQQNGAPRDSVCRTLLLALHRAGHITLPEPRVVWQTPRRHVMERPQIDVPQIPIEGSFADLGPVEIRQVRRAGVRRSREEALVDSLITQHHYLGYAHPVGEHLKYLVSARGQPIGCFCWSSPQLHLRLRDEYIGWSREQRAASLRSVAYQSRFLILPWVRVPHLASHLLGRMSRQLSADWERVYAHPIYLTTTFVDAARFRGTCYRAANWTDLGLTLGRGHRAPTLVGEPTRPRKQLFVYPLVKDFRRRLGIA
jgi:hypothetical protein